MTKNRTPGKLGKSLVILLWAAFSPAVARAVDLSIGVMGGLHMASGQAGGESFNTSFFSSLFAEAGVGRTFAVGIGYQAGSSLLEPSVSAQSPFSEWSVRGVEAVLTYRHPLTDVTPFGGISLGRFWLEPKSPVANGSSPGKAAAFSASVVGGFKAFLSRAFFGILELRYAFLSFKPEGESIDLGGLRLSLGGGLSFDL